MSISDRIKEAAKEIADGFEAQASTLQRELREIEARKVEVELALKSAQLNRKRLLDFQPINANGDPFCPRCFVRENLPIAMRAVDGGTGHDAFRCRNCGFEILIPV